MALEFSWRLSTADAPPGTERNAWQAQPGAWIQLALALEYAGIEGVWIDQGIGQPESLAVAATLCAHTRQLALTVSIAPEVMLPAALAATLQSLQSISHQRARLYLPDSARNSAYRAFGEFLNRDQRCERIGEYLELLTRLLEPQTEPFNHSGGYFQLENAGMARRDLAAPALILDHSQGPELCARHADQCLIPLAPLPATRAHIQSLKRAALAHRRAPGFVCHLALMLGDTEALAWRAAEQQLHAQGRELPKARAGVSDLSKAFGAIKRLLLHPNLWQPANDSPVYLVGTAAQIAARLETLHELGFTQIILHSSQGVADVLRFAEQVLPLLNAKGLRDKESAHV